jgi:putative hydrolase of HD superfamily
MLIDFFKIAANLKNVPRQGWIDKDIVSNPESVAEHVYSTTIMAMLLSDVMELDTRKIIKMSLLHDLAESEIGDITPENMNKEHKKKLEDDVMKKILCHIPKKQQKEYQELWNEFEENKSIESEFIHQIDKIEMIIQAQYYNQAHNIPKEKLLPFIKTAKNKVSDARLVKVLDEVIKRIE